MTDYPEHEKLEKVRLFSQAIGEFLDWMGNEKMYFIAEYPPGSDYAQRVHANAQDLLAEYFKIDRTILEREKRTMLSEIREANKSTTVADTQPIDLGGHR